MEVLKLENLNFSYDANHVLKDVSYSFESGKIYAITGKSGAGKTTLLSILSGLAEPDSGVVSCKGQNLKQVNQYDYRSRDIGVIFQNFNLLTKLTAVENVLLSMDISGIKNVNKKQRAYRLLKSVGITDDEANRRILKLSGGQQQRVAIARALSYEPEIILADEPTGNLDEGTQAEIMEILQGLAARGKCVIIVTHSSYVAGLADEVFKL
ncbi:MAG: ABC transporter ATP-binding protein [Bacillota bacterium]|nr:ABC transporter ATP-binding protein [Bacillota bacterium]